MQPVALLSLRPLAEVPGREQHWFMFDGRKPVSTKSFKSTFQAEEKRQQVQAGSSPTPAAAAAAAGVSAGTGKTAARMARNAASELLRACKATAACRKLRGSTSYLVVHVLK